MAKRILFITLSNIGDVILTLPVLDRIKANFPGSSITVLSSRRVEEIFCTVPCVTKFIAYDKRMGYKEKIRLFLSLLKEDFDQIIDLRDTFLGFILKIKNGIFPLKILPKSIKHMKNRHLFRSGLRTCAASQEKCFSIEPKNQEHIDSLFHLAGISRKDIVIAVSAGARSNAKIWPKESFLKLASVLIGEFKAKIILVGDKADSDVCRYINESLDFVCLDLSGKTNLRELACVLRRSDLLVSNDSAVMHMASYLDTPVVAIFGITDENKYGPWSKKSFTVKKEIYCRPCKKAQCFLKTRACFNLIKVDDVLQGIRYLLSKEEKAVVSRQPAYKRILIVRTDRIGDVLLSTPFVRAIRQNYPNAFISMIVSPYSKDIVNGNPWIDEVITYDKEFKHRNWFSTLVFARNLRKYKFDVAFILHPTNRVHLITWLAGIPQRIGYNRKLSFLLTDKFIHRKHLGEKHELEYTMDFLSILGIEYQNKSLFMPLKEESEKWAEELMSKHGLKSGDKFLLINPAASCPSKVWSPERFSEVADRLSTKYGFKVFIVAGPKDLALAGKVINNMRVKAFSLAGKTSVSQLASILKRATLFISNDSGPVHIASAVGTPVIAIFGRKQPGLSPKRWGPVGLKDKFLHKDVGCVECLAHNCKKGFACLRAITVDDVILYADSILQ